MQVGPQLAPCFNREVRERGFEYFRRRQVRILSGGAAELDAEVRGTENYHVILRRAADAVQAYCECLYFLDRRLPCKHLWAAVLAGDQAGHLQNLVPPGGVPHLDVDSILIEFQEELGLDQQPSAKPLALAHTHRPRPKEIPAWRKALDPLFAAPAPRCESHYAPRNPWPPGSELVYLLERPSGPLVEDLTLGLHSRELRKAGGWKKPQKLRMTRAEIQEIPWDEDREMVALLVGSSESYQSVHYQFPNPLRLSQPLAQLLMPRILRSGRCFLGSNTNDISDAPLVWDDGPPWELVLELKESEFQQQESQQPESRQPESRQLGKQANLHALQASLRRLNERMELDRALHVYPSGFLLTTDRLAAVASGTSPRWLNALKNDRDIVVPEEQLPTFLEQILRAADAPRLELPPSIGIESSTQPPQPQLNIKQERDSGPSGWLRAHLIFHYAERPVPEHDESNGFLDAAARRWLRRDRERESEARRLLTSLGLVPVDSHWQQPRHWRLDPAQLSHVAAALLAAGWSVTADGKPFRTASVMRSEITSGIDWFDLKGEVDFGEDTTAQLPELLAALARGESAIEFGDGSYGILPEQWLRQFAAIGAMGRAQKDAIRFSSAQAGFLDALLATQPAIDCDAVFARIREQLRRFERVEPAKQPAGFVGELRGYQREGLGWLQFLQSFGFGGCLADDMGVGKTAQVLALLETRRALRASGKVTKPSIAIVPKSLVFNWKQEAGRFTPQLRVIDHTGIGRDPSRMNDCDLVLTTYGTLRRDIALLQQIAFDYVILDEAQAIKNAQTDSSKSVRLLRGDHRLAMSGTPVENHIGELWSLFEFLNPGLLGAASIFKATASSGRALDDATLAILKRGVRPFILRRTKEEVAQDLPTKTEQTLYCELEPRERKLYNQLRQHYRESLLPQIGSQGVAKTRIQVLEALLRLRQAACHPGLVDKAHRARSSAKLDLLFEQLDEVLEEGHKALVFSQFTSLLDLARKRLDSEKIPYEYLDGKTRDRAACVERFQTDPEVRLFLISLKAGGVGLNLTAADYVFILDPWWNPAAEAQAVDRTHRIGQQRRVFAYRLIARDTVEEKVLELQKNKRALADAILGGSTSLVRDLSREEIELLLS